MTIKERQERIIARGEHSNHSHVIVGDNVTINRKGEKIIVNVEDGEAYIKHLLESKWMEGQEVWTGEHKDIKLEKGTYEYVQQQEYDPFEGIIRDVID